jgi:hypothetical protein
MFDFDEDDDPVLYDEVIEPYWSGGDIEWNQG